MYSLMAHFQRLNLSTSHLVPKKRSFTDIMTQKNKPDKITCWTRRQRHMKTSSKTPGAVLQSLNPKIRYLLQMGVGIEAVLDDEVVQ